VARRREWSSEQFGDGLNQLGAHLRGAVGVLDGMQELLLVGLDAAEQETITKLADYAVIAVIDTSAAEQHPDLAVPFQNSAASGANDPRPLSIIDLTQRGEELGLGLGSRAQNGAEVFEYQKSKCADLVEQSASGAGGPLPSWCARKQSGYAYGPDHFG